MAEHAGEKPRRHNQLDREYGEGMGTIGSVTPHR
jgi:hypothetical protein